MMPGSIELRDPVHGPIAVSPGELDVIDTPIFQRLRGIKQLGFAEYVFPGAVHHRYLHSIGAMHVGGQLVDRVMASLALGTAADRARLRQLVRLAALLHDVGHAPMSHAAEGLLPRRSQLGLAPAGEGDPPAGHEEVTHKLVTESHIATAIASAFGGLGVTPADVAAVIAADPGDRRGAFRVAGVDTWPLLHAMVSGELDVDRMDYLLRDSLFAGVQYGHYDKDWLLSNAGAVVDEGVARLAIDIRALPSFEHFLLARYHMFQMVYFHPKSDVYDAMLERWLESVGDAARFPATPEAYVRCDDAWLRAKLIDSEDPWARRVVTRRPFSLLAELRSDADRAHRDAIDAALMGAAIEPLWITARPVLSRYARSPAELRTNPLFVVDRRPPMGGERRHRIEDVTDLFGRYERTMRVERVYVAPDQRAAAQALLAAMSV